jgi:hypothetical protein
MLPEKPIEAIRRADAVNPWEPGRIEHLLAFGAKYPEEQRSHPILALASVALVGGVPCVACPRWDGLLRYLALPWWHRGWNRRCRFLAIRKLGLF